MTKESTVSGRSKEIRDMLKLRHWDEEFGTREMQARDPYRSLQQMLNGFIIVRKN